MSPQVSADLERRLEEAENLPYQPPVYQENSEALAARPEYQLARNDFTSLLRIIDATIKQYSDIARTNPSKIILIEDRRALHNILTTTTDTGFPFGTPNKPGRSLHQYSSVWLRNTERWPWRPPSHEGHGDIPQESRSTPVCPIRGPGVSSKLLFELGKEYKLIKVADHGYGVVQNLVDTQLDAYLAITSVQRGLLERYATDGFGRSQK